MLWKKRLICISHSLYAELHCRCNGMDVVSLLAEGDLDYDKDCCGNVPYIVCRLARWQRHKSARCCSVECDSGWTWLCCKQTSASETDARNKTDTIGDLSNI